MRQAFSPPPPPPPPSPFFTSESIDAELGQTDEETLEAEDKVPP